MPADGLTKPLPRQEHEIFIRQLGLVDVRRQVKEETDTMMRAAAKHKAAIAVNMQRPTALSIQADSEEIDSS